MTANDYLISVIGLFLAMSGFMYLRHMKSNGEGGKREKTVSIVLIVLGLIVLLLPFRALIPLEASDEADISRKGSLLGDEVYDRALPQNTDNYEEASALYARAVALWNLNTASYDSIELAQDLLNRSIKLYETPEALTARGQLKVQLGKFNSAMDDYFRAVELNPEFGNAYYNRAAVYYITGRVDYACSDWQTAHDLGVPNTEDVLKLYCRN